MAGTRCANPEYQPVVDNMMLEYVLYKCVHVHLQLLAALSERHDISSSCDESGVAGLANAALKLTESYDALVTLHKTNHDPVLSENTQRNGQILRLLVHLNSWVLSRVPNLEDLVPKASDSMQEMLQQSMIMNHLCRQMWLKAHGSSQIAWDSELGSSWHLRSTQHSLPGHILPVFMSVSVELFKISKNSQLSHPWMRLAGSFMVQAAIEVLDAPDLLTWGDEIAKNALEECFAWGCLEQYNFEDSIQDAVRDAKTKGLLVPTTVGLDDIARMEDSCQKMFSATVPGSPASRREIPAWTNTREEMLQDVLMAFVSIQEAGSDASRTPIRLLRKRYKLTSLLSDMHDFVAIHWKLLHSTAWHGKPILVQIEEGGIDGVTADEFERFKGAAGIGEMWNSVSSPED